MKKIMLAFLIFAVVIIAGIIYGAFSQSNGKNIKTGAAKVGNNVFEIEIVKSFADLARGLSDRESLEKNKGMLFEFMFSAKHGFWMKDMKLPLDIIWIKDNKIVGIEKNVPAPTETSNNLQAYYPPEYVNRVLEINAGLSDELGIKAGDEIEINN